ncbi:MAG: hypothetical protein IJM15_03515 [Erysipelotrichaceae bacterium]|nr:hypothetical protein [Erysipelotrichaceae bacterium]
MIYSYPECIKKWQSDYQIKKQIAEGSLFLIEKGIYSDTPDVSALAVICKKYPKGIITMDSAFFYHGLTDTIPDRYHIATESHSFALSDERIAQHYVQLEILDKGAITMKHRDTTFRIYDKERMLIELLRYKNKLPFDYYKEIIGNYRDIIHKLDIERIQEYAEVFPKHKLISERLDAEVF